MKFQIKYIIDESKMTKDRIRDIKLQFIQDNVHTVITSDYPIPVTDNNSIVFLGSIKFKILNKVTEVTQDYYTIVITICDEETLFQLDKMEADECRRIEQLTRIMKKSEYAKKKSPYEWYKDSEGHKKWFMSTITNLT